MKLIDGLFLISEFFVEHGGDDQIEITVSDRNYDIIKDYIESQYFLVPSDIPSESMITMNNITIRKKQI